jgi:preprotein translocase subunit SecY
MSWTGEQAFRLLIFGGTSIIIIVGVALETTRAIESEITMRHYKGFLE